MVSPGAMTWTGCPFLTANVVRCDSWRRKISLIAFSKAATFRLPAIRKVRGMLYRGLLGSS